MAIWKEGNFLGSWYAELSDGLNLKVFYNPIDPDRLYQARVFDYHTLWAATLEEAKQAAERIAREILSQALAALDEIREGGEQ